MKTHLAESQVPLTEGQTVWTLCQKQVPNSVWMFRWLPGESFELESQSTLLLCRHCVNALTEGRFQGDHVYMYGVQNREELKGRAPGREAMEESA